MTVDTRAYATISPNDGKEYKSYDFLSEQELEQKLQQAREGYAYMSQTSSRQRKDILNSLADLIDASSDELAQIITLEMGKPITQARGEVTKCAGMCRYHAEHLDSFLAKERIETDDIVYEIHQESLGPVLFISTWNNPMLQACLALVPQVVAGNSVLIKPSPNAPQTVLCFGKLIQALKLSVPIYIPVMTSIEQTEALLLNTDIRGVTFIGSTRVGHRVGELAGKTFKAAVIDAGGSDPYVVLADADVEQAAKAAVGARFGNAGQSCVAAKRIIVAKEIFTEFTEILLTETKKLVLGDPMDEATTLGPLAKHSFRDEIKKYIDESLSMGAELLLGGDIPDNPGAFLNPTIVSKVSTDMPLAQNEIFGPVAVLFEARDSEHAIRLANATEFGLGASLWTAGQQELAAQIKTGNVAINSKIATNYPVPFGGCKDSGFGVYFGIEGVRTFTNSKVISWAKA